MMSAVFAGPVDKHNAVVVDSTGAEERRGDCTAEFGAKLSSKFFAFFCTFQGRAAHRFPNDLHSQTGRNDNIYSLPG